MARYSARLARLEKMVTARSVPQETYVTFALAESLEQAVRAAESETGLPLLEIHPYALSAAVGKALVDALLEGEMEIVR